MLNPRTNTSIFAWIVATSYTVKLLSLIAKPSDSSAFVQRNRFSRLGPTNLNFRGATHEQHLSEEIQRELNITRDACLQSKQNRENLLVFLWWSLTIQSFLHFIRPPRVISLSFTFWNNYRRLFGTHH